jgi:uncharacterized membrane protein
VSNARTIVLALSALSAAAMLYVGAYQARFVPNLVCPLFKKGCEAVADAAFARPFGIPDGFIAAGMYAVMLGLFLLLPPQGAGGWARYALRIVSILAALANVQGVLDMHGMGAYCFYCLLTTVAAPALVWACFVV